MTTAAEFIFARIAEDERTAERADKTWNTTMRGVPKGSAGHVGRWDPYQVRLECDAKRRIVISCSEMQMSTSPEATHLATQTLRSLAKTWCDHRDYSPEW